MDETDMGLRYDELTGEAEEVGRVTAAGAGGESLVRPGRRGEAEV